MAEGREKRGMGKIEMEINGGVERGRERYRRPVTHQCGV